jgi:O-antigen/teichoic acid export membrane protein
VSTPADEGLRSQAITGVMWTALQKWSVRLSTFVAFLLLGRLLEPRDFGIVALASAFIVVLTVLADAGFATYLVQVRELTREAINTAFYISTGAGVLLSLLLCLAARPLAALLGAHELVTVLPALALSLVFVGLSSVPAALLSRELRFQALAMRQVLATLLSVVVAVALALAGAGVWALVAQTLVRQVIASAVLMVATSFRPERAFSRPEARKMLGYSTKAMGAQLLAQLRDQGEALLIGALAGPIALGLWTVASRLVLVVGDLLGTVLGTVAVPLFARVQNEPRRLSRAIAATSSIAMLVLAPALVSMALVSTELVPHVFGKQWAGAATIATFLALRGVFIGASALDRAVLLSSGHAGGELRVIAVLTGVHIALVAALASHGVNLLALVLLVEAALCSPIRPWLIRHWLSVPYRTYAPAARVAVATALAGAVTFAVLHGFDVTGVQRYAVVAVIGGGLYLSLVTLLARPVVTEAISALTHLRGRRVAVQLASAPVVP